MRSTLLLILAALSTSNAFVVQSPTVSFSRTSPLAMSAIKDLESKSKDELIAIIKEQRQTKANLFAEEKATLPNKTAVRLARSTIAEAGKALFEKHGVAMSQSEAFDNKKKLGVFTRN
mmetsp:Transcript_30900/g.61185  ORF Transcript_30900/g.61185 Transcript_30900/m.61185 type:complete len:118 (+) Transcript_30900:153-506(+)